MALGEQSGKYNLQEKGHKWVDSLSLSLVMDSNEIGLDKD